MLNMYINPPPPNQLTSSTFPSLFYSILDICMSLFLIPDITQHNQHFHQYTTPY